MITDEASAILFCRERTDSRAFERLELFARLLAAENARQNLISAATLGSIWLRHFADSLQLLDHVPRETPQWLDLGSGAGFPGVVLAIARPEARFVLIESRKRRVEWLMNAAIALDLSNCEIVGARLESVETVHSGAITARAFAPLGRLLRLSARFSTPNTLWVLPKGRSAAQELAEQPPGVQNMFHVERSATDPLGGILVGRGTPPVT